MPLRDRQAFYDALDRFTALRRWATPGFRWSADGRELSWTAGQGDGAVGRACRLDAGEPRIVAAPQTCEEPAAPAWRTFPRETYLVPEYPAPEAPSPDGRWFASVRQGEVSLRSAGEEPDRTLTAGATEDIAWDLETAGVDPWSPDGKWLLATRMDRRAVWRDVRTRFDHDGTVRVDHPRVQRAGAALDIVQPHLIPTGGGPARSIDLGEMRDHFLRLVGWLPDSSAVVLLRLTRALDRAELFVVDAQDARARTVFIEQCPTFLRLDPIIWGGPTGCDLLPDRRFVWQSERDGWNHLYLGELDAGPGAPLRQLTHGEMSVHDVVRCHGGEVWFRARVDGPRPYDLHLYRVPLAGGAVRQVSEGEGEHACLISPDGSHFVDTASTPCVAPRSVLRRADGMAVLELDRLDPAPLLGTHWTPPLEVVVTAADGQTALHGVLYRPAGFDPGRRYPLLHWVYGGPQMRVAPKAFAPRTDNDILHHALADAGYLVLVLDARGTPQRSKAFQDVVWRSFVDHVVADQAGALRQLMGLHPWIDPQRMGVLGRSWGASFALHLLAAAPDLYRAAACTVPGFDPCGGLIAEPYLGLPQDDPAPYRNAEPWALPQRIDKCARILLMAGTLDSPQQWNLQRMSHLLVEADISHQTLVFAEQEHAFEGPALRFHQRALRDFFDEALA
jgi:dipeptidyl aminopeptidase/acylaminoacyl peptidase